ncbi:hypothetical protein PROFUN_14443 [Planoprotostelium fungivorum]|uniref:Uncharacterized protein n=1 Tax=Planoprotostelium fungivorum TaxID=1890364 RepID=A0A2P6MX81_9EUKA|nr:hypothetical protein PROFUN_14443 [Planoprotostelium fungivorum]
MWSCGPIVCPAPPDQKNLDMVLLSEALRNLQQNLQVYSRWVDRATKTRSPGSLMLLLHTLQQREHTISTLNPHRVTQGKEERSPSATIDADANNDEDTDANNSSSKDEAKPAESSLNEDSPPPTKKGTTTSKSALAGTKDSNHSPEPKARTASSTTTATRSTRSTSNQAKAVSSVY